MGNRILARLTLAVLIWAGGVAQSIAGGDTDSIELSGDVLQYALPATAASLTLFHKDTEGAWQFGKSALVTVGVTMGLKYGIDARRPNGGSHSFPSGHTSISFASAEFMRKRYGWAYGIPTYAAASYVAWTRVEARKHYERDVIAGAGIGILSSYIFTTPYKGWNVSIEGDTKSVGLRLGRAF